MGIKVTGQFEPAGDFTIVDARDVAGNITGSNISASGFVSASSFSGDGSNLTGVADEASISGSWRGELSSSGLTYVGGGVSGSSISTGSFGIVQADILEYNVQRAGDIIATGDIYAAGIISASIISASGDITTEGTASAGAGFFDGTVTTDIIKTSNSDLFSIRDNNDDIMFQVSGLMVVLGKSDTPPTAVSGGMYYSGSDEFFLADMGG